MEGAYLMVFEAMIAAGILSVVSTVRFHMLWRRNEVATPSISSS